MPLHQQLSVVGLGRPGLPRGCGIAEKGKGPPSPLYSRCGQSYIAGARAGAATVQQHFAPTCLQNVCGKLPCTGLGCQVFRAAVGMCIVRFGC